MKTRFVSFHYTLKNKQGEVLDSSYEGEPMMFLEGANQIMSVLEAGIKDLHPGDKKQIFVHSSDAYGDRDEKLVIEIPLSKLPAKQKVKAGQQFRLQSAKLGSRVYRVVQSNSTHARLDANHPLAGQDLYFHVEVVEMRAATQQEPPLPISIPSGRRSN